MGLIDPTHLLVIAIVVLLVIGPRRLPEVARALGRAAHEFREAMSEGPQRTGDDRSLARDASGAWDAQEHTRG